MYRGQLTEPRCWEEDSLTLEKELNSSSVKSIYLTTERSIPAANFYQNNGFTYSEKMGFYTKSGLLSQ